MCRVSLSPSAPVMCGLGGGLWGGVFGPWVWVVLFALEEAHWAQQGILGLCL
jgi:hypothetical protein